MSHFAKVVDGIVTQRIVAEAEYISTQEGEWIQTSYNTVAGAHSDGGVPLRKNFASKGDTYDKVRDAFYSPQPHPSWTLDEATCQWQPPTAMPDDDKRYIWNEATTSWDKTV